MLALALLAGCGGGNIQRQPPSTGGGGGFGGSSSGSGGSGGGGTGGVVMTFDGGAGSDGGADDGGASCGAVIESHADEGATHLDCHATPDPMYGTNPPSSGNHFDYWPDFKTYTTPIPWGNLVHALEHGAVVIVYNCPDGCADEVAQAQAFIDSLPADPLCIEPDPRRVILAPDPTLTRRWGASAWTWTLNANCFHLEAFTTFVRDHYAHGRENLCGELGVGPAGLCP